MNTTSQTSSTPAPVHFPVDMVNSDNALAETKRAARLLLESHVATVTLRCRADLSLAERAKLDHQALEDRRRGLMIAARSQVRAHYQIDDDDLCVASIAIARFRSRGEHCQEKEYTQRAIDRAIISSFAIRHSDHGIKVVGSGSSAQRTSIAA